MKIHKKIKDEKLKCNIIRKAAQVSALLSGRINIYECLAGEEILASGQCQIIQ